MSDSAPAVAGTSAGRRLADAVRGGGLRATLIRGVAGGGGVRILGMGLSFLVGLQLARGLGPDGYGIYALAMSTVALLSVPSEFGVPQVVTRELAAGSEAKDWSRASGVMRWADRSVLALSLLTAAAAAAWAWTQEGPLAATVLWAALLVPIVGLAKVRDSALRGLMRVVLGQVPNLIVRPGMMSLFLAVATLSGVVLTAPRAMALHVLAAGVTLVVGAALLRRATPPPMRDAAPTTSGRSWMAAAAPMGLTDGVRVLQGHSAVLLLGALAASESVGIYQVAARVGTLAAMPVGLMNVVLAPTLSKLHTAGDRPRTARTLNATALAMFAGVGLLSLPLILFGEPLLTLAFGEAYAGSARPTAIVCLSGVLSAAAGPNAVLLNMTGHERRVTVAFVASLPVSLITGLALIPRFGAEGAAWSVVAGTVAWNGVLWWACRARAGFDPTVLAPLLPSPLMTSRAPGERSQTQSKTDEAES